MQSEKCKMKTANWEFLQSLFILHLSFLISHFPRHATWPKEATYFPTYVTHSGDDHAMFPSACSMRR